MELTYVKNVSIAESVTSIGKCAFDYCLDLTSINIPLGLKTIEEASFAQLWSLKSITLPPNLETIGYRAFFECKVLESISIPASVKSIGAEAFAHCPVKSMIYHGYSDPGGSGCDYADFVCVPDNYSSSSFCGINNFCRSDSCESITRNKCYTPVCENSTIVQTKRKNATQWENRTNGCFKFECTFDYGPVYWKDCNSTETTERVCEDDQCKVIETNKKDQVVVEIEVEGIDVTTTNITEIRSILSNLTNITVDELIIRAEINDKNEIVRIIVLVDNENTAEIISSTINDHDPEEIGSRVRFKRANVKFLGDASRGNIVESSIFMIMIIFMMFIIEILYE